MLKRRARTSSFMQTVELDAHTQQTLTNQKHQNQDYDIELNEYVNQFGQLKVKKIDNTEKDKLNSKSVIVETNPNMDKSICYMVDWGQLVEEEYQKVKKCKGCLFDCLRQCVSLKKRRTQKEGFDLDLIHITKNIIAMGFPAEGGESWYRNNRQKVIQYLKLKHDSNVKIYNLCFEKDKQYAKSDLPGAQDFKLQKFPFMDHNICSIRTIFSFCFDAYLYLQEKYQQQKFMESKGQTVKEAAIAVHCKAGKGRTGLMISAFLVFSDCGFEDPKSAIDHYNRQRTMNLKGLTIQSQIRYVHLFHKFMEREINKPYFYNSVINYHKILQLLENQENERLKLFTLCIGPFRDAKSEVNGFNFEISKLASDGSIQPIFNYSKLINETKFVQNSNIEFYDNNGEYYLIVKFNQQIMDLNQLKLTGDFKIKVKSKTCQFYLWLNISAIKNQDLENFTKIDLNPQSTELEILQALLPRNVQVEPEANQDLELDSPHGQSKTNKDLVTQYQKYLLDEQIEHQQQLIKAQTSNQFDKSLIEHMAKEDLQGGNGAINNDDDDELNQIKRDTNENINIQLLWNAFEDKVKTQLSNDKALLEKKCENKAHFQRQFYKVDLHKDQLDKFHSKGVKEMSVSLLLYDEYK